MLRAGLRLMDPRIVVICITKAVRANNWTAPEEWSLDAEQGGFASALSPDHRSEPDRSPRVYACDSVRIAEFERNGRPEFGSLVLGRSLHVFGRDTVACLLEIQMPGRWRPYHLNHFVHGLASGAVRMRLRDHSWTTTRGAVTSLLAEGGMKVSSSSHFDIVTAILSPDSDPSVVGLVSQPVDRVVACDLIASVLRRPRSLESFQIELLWGKYGNMSQYLHEFVSSSRHNLLVVADPRLSQLGPQLYLDAYVRRCTWTYEINLIGLEADVGLRQLAGVPKKLKELALHSKENANRLILLEQLLESYAPTSISVASRVRNVEKSFDRALGVAEVLERTREKLATIDGVISGRYGILSQIRLQWYAIAIACLSLVIAGFGILLTGV